jgi:hypothetical protein
VPAAAGGPRMILTAIYVHLGGASTAAWILSQFYIFALPFLLFSYCLPACLPACRHANARIHNARYICLCPSLTMGSHTPSAHFFPPQ